jgi:1,4-alpha-glucan branching enzyme
MARKTEARRQEFAYTAPDARSVQLVGDFTEWTRHPVKLTRGSDGRWHTAVQMQPGAHRYRFLVDGEWRDDPACKARLANPYGSEDAVRQVV